MSHELASPEDQAVRILCSKDFHRVLWLPETADHSELRVTYSTTNNFDDFSLPVILFIGPMFGSRWTAVTFDKVARDSGVRLICTDRPATGGSTPVPINIRMKVWLETVPALLQKLDIKHVSLMTHSAGTVYTLNTLLRHRTVLDPKAPTVAFLAPYVPTAASGAVLTTLLSILPTGMIDSWADLNVFINKNVTPSASWSSGVFSSAASIFSSFRGIDIPGSEVSASTTEAERYGVDEETAKAIERLSMQYKFAEEINGANEEAKLCLRKCDGPDWGEAQDYETCIRSIARNERALQKEDPGRAKLKIEAFFSGSDIMSGKRGQEYFEQCWQQEEVKESVDFVTQTYHQANHDSILLDYKQGALRDAFEKIVRSAMRP